MRQAIALVDVDDVCCDLLTEWLRRYNRDYDDILTPADIRSWEMTDWVSARCGKKIYDYLRDQGDMYDHAIPIEGAREGVNALREFGYRVIFVTSSSAVAMGHKLEWLMDYDFLPRHEYVHPDFICAHAKNLIRGDLLIDDRVENVTTFPGWKFLFTQPHNESVVLEPGIHRVKGWKHAIETIGTLQEAMGVEVTV